jgi:DHA1 family bicyclomycin/chloramphenicol resistance-like MFS transporter
VLAPLVGGQIVTTVGWRAVFWVLAGFGVVCLLMVAIGLPETLPVDRRSSAGPRQALELYGRLLADRQFLGYALAAGLISAGMFAYIAGSPFVFIELYGVAPERYGWIFVLVVVAATGAGGLVGLLIPLFVCVAGVGLVGPNATAAAMADYGHAAGSASALLGALQFLAGAAASALVGALYNGTALPMAAVIAACGAAALLAYIELVAGRSRRIARRDVDGA